MTGPCPWYVTAHAVRRYMALGGAPGKSFDDASDDLIERCAEVWQRYQANPDLEPDVTKTGAYVYRGPEPLRIRVVVSMERRPEGPRPQVVDVISVERRESRVAAKRGSPSAVRRRILDRAKVEYRRWTGDPEPKLSWEEVRRERFSDEEIAVIVAAEKEKT